MTVAPGLSQPTSSRDSTSSTSWTAGHVVAAVLAGIVILGSLLVGGAGVSLLVANDTVRDQDGFVTTPVESFGTTTYAVTTGPLELHLGGPAARVPRVLVGRVRISVEDAGGGPIFVGIAPAEDAARYLDGVAHAELVEMRDTAQSTPPRYREVPGGAPGTQPGEASIWEAKAEGPGERSIVWEPRDGDWTVVVMNADGDRDVRFRAAAGATFPALGPVAVALLVAAALGFLLATLILSLTLWHTSRPAPHTHTG